VTRLICLIGTLCKNLDIPQRSQSCTSSCHLLTGTCKKYMLELHNPITSRSSDQLMAG